MHGANRHDPAHADFGTGGRGGETGGTDIDMHMELRDCGG